MLDFVVYFGLILLAVLTVGAIWLLVQGMAREGRLNPRAIPILVGVPAIVLGAVVVLRFPQLAPEPSTIHAGLTGSGRTDPFYLEGSYGVGLTLRSPQGGSCHLVAKLFSEQSSIAVQTLTSAPLEPSPSSVGSGRLRGLAGGRYYVEGDSNCEWRVTLTPIADAAGSAESTREAPSG